MEKPLLLILFHVLFGLWAFSDGFPIDFSSVGTGQAGATFWVSGSPFLAVAFLIVAIGIVFGCVCCRNGKGFQQNEVKEAQEFNNSTASLSVPTGDGFVNPTASSELTIFPPFGVSSTLSNRSSIVRFEPLPDIKIQHPNLRPAAFSYGQQEISSQDWFYEPHNNFPRNQLKYLQDYGRGWFGRVVEGEAQNIVPNEKLTKVIVKILHEDATPTDQMYFLHEVKFYRDLRHPNILKFLGRCLETEPFLVLLESCPNGDLKTFLSQNLASARALTEQGITLRMCYNITSGLQFMHENKFIHTDLAARNCLVAPDLTIKIGDYGNSIEIFKSDYYCAGSVALPVRWCAPETLKCTDVTIETKEVTPLANVWTLAIVIWEICEFCKLPYSELNDDQVIVRVVTEKNYFLSKPKLFCLYKDELYHLMKLCWNPPLQRPNASQIRVILENLLSSGKGGESELDPKRASQDFELRWQNSKPNYIPKTDNAFYTEDNSNVNLSSSMFKSAKVADSTEMTPGVFMSNKSAGQDSPRFCLKSEKKEIADDDDSFLEGPIESSDNLFTEEKVGREDFQQTECSKTGTRDPLDEEEELKEAKQKVEFDYNVQVKPPEILKPDYKLQESDVDSWLKGVEVNNEEDKKFVRKISEAIRDLDEALAMEKTSSSEENSSKSSHHNSPGKEFKPKDEAPVVDFKLGGDTMSYMSFTPKPFELSSLQNTEEPQSLTFAGALKRSEFQSLELENYVQESLLFAHGDGKIKSCFFDESLKDGDSLAYSQSRNSSDTEDEIWRKRIEKGEFSEKVKEKSKSIADLMILTHIDTSDESDYDVDKNFERHWNRNSLSRRSGSNLKNSLTSNNFGSENNITNAVLEETFKESLKKLSSDHKEYGRFDSLGTILPVANRKDSILEFLKNGNEDSTGEEQQQGEEQSAPAPDFGTEPSDFFQKQDNSNSHNNFLVNVASEKLVDNNVNGQVQVGASPRILDAGRVVNASDDELGKATNCDNCKITFINTAEDSSSQMNNENGGIEAQESAISGNFSGDSILNMSDESQGAFKINEDSGNNVINDVISNYSQTDVDNKVTAPEVEEEITLVEGKNLVNIIDREGEITSEISELITANEYKDVNSDSGISDATEITEQSDSNGNDSYTGEEVKKSEDCSVIIGACEDYTLEYFKGLKTSFGESQEAPPEKDSNLDGWDEHLEKTMTQNLSNSNFDDITFASLEMGVNETATEDRDILGESFNTTPVSPNKSIVTVIESKKPEEEKMMNKIEEPLLINAFTNLNGNNSEEEYDNCKLRTPDDERSSDSGFRDKGSLSESVEDACEGKYDLQDIEAELEEAYVKGAFGNCEIEKEKAPAADSNNFEFEEAKFYEDENKNDDDFSDIDGEIEFWQNKNSDYYPEISEFSPSSSKGWYLHPPDSENFSKCDMIDDEFVVALRKELKEKLPVQARSYEEFENDFSDFAFENGKTDINIQYAGNFVAPLSPIFEEQGRDTKEIAEYSLTDASQDMASLQSQRTHRNISNIMESVKTIDTETFRLYIDYMIENEGKELDDEERDIAEEIVQAKDDEVNEPMFIIAKDNTKELGNRTFEEDIKNALGVEGLSGSESFISDNEQPKSIVLFEDLESDSKCKVIEETKPDDDILVVNTETNEVTLLESPKPKSYVAFVANDSEKDDDILEVVTDDSEFNFTPDSISPERERSLSDTSRSSNGTRTGDASSEITLSSPDFLSDYFLTPNSEKSPVDSPKRQATNTSETEVEEIVQNNEADEIINELRSMGIVGDEAEGTPVADQHPNGDSCSEKNECSLPYIPTKYTVQTEKFLRHERMYTSSLLEESSKILKQFDTSEENPEETSLCESGEDKLEDNGYEISTSFMGDDGDYDEEEEEEEKGENETSTGMDQDQKSSENTRNAVEDTYTPDWESDSSEEGEASSSSEEFIWKDGDRESEVKAVHATAQDFENSLYEKSQSDNSTLEKLNEDFKEKSKDQSEDTVQDDDEYDNEDDGSSTGSSASITDFVPSAWNSQATPSRPAMRSPDKKSEQQPKRNIRFKKQKYHCVYEYPREPSDTEEVEPSYKNFTYGITTSEPPNKHFTYGISTPDVSNKHFTYGISNLIDYSTFADWDFFDGDDGDLSLTDTDSDNSKNGKNAQEKKTDHNFYNLSTFDCDFNNSGTLSDEGEFFVSSSARPFQGNSSSQFFPGGSHFTGFNSDAKDDQLWKGETDGKFDDFITPDSGVEDLTTATPLEKQADGENPTLFLNISEKKENNGEINNVLDNLQFNFESNEKKVMSEAFGESTSSSPNDLSTSSSNSPASPLSPTGLGELRHTRDKLKLDLPHNHNTDLGIALNNTKTNKIH